MLKEQLDPDFFFPKLASLPEEALNTKSTCSAEASLCSVKSELEGCQELGVLSLVKKAQRKDRIIEISWKGETGNSQRFGIEIKTQRILKVYRVLLHLDKLLLKGICGKDCVSLLCLC